MVSNKKQSEKSRLLSLGNVQWVSGVCISLGVPLLNWTLIQTSLPFSLQRVIDIINQYRPTGFIATPTLLTCILKSDKQCDMTSIKSITYGGFSSHKDELQQNVKLKLHHDVMIREVYGQTEVVGLAACTQPDTPSGSCGKPFPQFTFKLVDLTTGKVITEPNKQGELWIKGPSFVEYYKNPEETANTLTKDGWVKTGDLFYMDHDQHFYFVERIKMVIRFQNNQIVVVQVRDTDVFFLLLHHRERIASKQLWMMAGKSAARKYIPIHDVSKNVSEQEKAMKLILPLEIEEVIQSHESVEEVCVTSIPDEVDSEHPVACVVCRPGSHITPEDIKTLVANELSDSKRLRGGVIFMEKMPKTSMGKLARGELRNFVKHAHKSGLLQ